MIVIRPLVERIVRAGQAQHPAIDAIAAPTIDTADLPFAVLALVVIGFIALPVIPVVLAGIAALCAIGWMSSGELRRGKVEEFSRARSRDDLLAEICRSRESIKSLCHDGSIETDWRAAYSRWIDESFSRNGEFENYTNCRPASR